MAQYFAPVYRRVQMPQRSENGPLRQLDTVPAAKREAVRMVNKNLQVPWRHLEVLSHAVYEIVVMGDIRG